MTWRLAHSLEQLLEETNKRWPSRSKVSDGTIGDADHASRSSDHNPWVKDGATGVVTAVDITSDDVGTTRDVADTIVATIVAARDPRVKYVIHDRRIWRSYAKPGIPAWSSAPYTGVNAHVKHVHVSVHSDKARYDSRAPWGIAEKPSRVDRARDLLVAALPHRPKAAQGKIRAALADLEGVN